MARNFFYMLSEVSREVVGKGELLETAFNRLVSFVESGVYTSSPSSKYIAKNWRLTSKELCAKWNDEEVSVKSENTFRSQVSTLSRQLYTLFPQVERAFIEEDRKAMQEILSTIALLIDGDEYFNDIFISELVDNYSDYSGREYPLEDCMKEISLLAMLRKRYIFEMLDLVNRDKMGYLQRVLQTPIASNRYRNINSRKIELLNLMQEYGDSTTLFDCAAEQTDGAFDSVYVDNYSKYGFSDMRELVTVMQDIASSDKPTGNAQREVKKLSAVRKLLNQDSMKDWLSDVGSESMKEFLRGMELSQKY